MRARVVMLLALAACESGSARAPAPTPAPDAAIAGLRIVFAGETRTVTPEQLTALMPGNRAGLPLQDLLPFAVDGLDLDAITHAVARAATRRMVIDPWWIRGANGHGMSIQVDRRGVVRLVHWEAGAEIAHLEGAITLELE